MRIVCKYVMFVLLLCFVSGSASGQEYTLLVEPDELKCALENREARFVDLRSEKEYNQMHIPGFENIPYKEESVLSLADEKKPVYLICSAGRRSALAYNILLQAGVNEVHACIFGVAEYAETMGETSMEGANICLPCLLLIEEEEIK